jgi:thymidylate synthase
VFSTFSGRTADELWRTVRQAFTNNKSLAAFQHSRGGDTEELLHVALVLENPRQRWVFAREPALNVAFALAEVVWMLCGRRDSAFLNYFNSQLPEFAGTGLTYHGAYGHRLIHHFEVDQLERAFDVLTANPASRQVVLQVWDCKADLPDHVGAPMSPDIPCNVVSLLKVRDARLEWLQIMRSNDVFRGLPHNIVQFTMLQEVLAGWLGIEVGAYHHLSDSLHVYKSDRNSLTRVSTKTPFQSTDVFATPKGTSQAEWREIESAVERIISPATCSREIAERADTARLSAACANVLRVLSAEGLRRRDSGTLAREVMEGCSNPAYRQLWQRWIVRLGMRIRS